MYVCMNVCMYVAQRAQMDDLNHPKRVTWLGGSLFELSQLFLCHVMVCHVLQGMYEKLVCQGSGQLLSI